MTNLEAISIWRAFHYNLARVINVSPQTITTFALVEQASEAIGLVDGLFEGLNAQAQRFGYDSVEEFYEQTYYHHDSLEL